MTTTSIDSRIAEMRLKYQLIIVIIKCVKRRVMLISVWNIEQLSVIIISIISIIIISIIIIINIIIILSSERIIIIIIISIN